MTLKLLRPLQYISRTDESKKTEQKISLKKFEYAPIEENTVVGSVELIIDGKAVDRTEILTAGAVQLQTVVAEEPTKEKSRIKKLIEKIKNILRNWM